MPNTPSRIKVKTPRGVEVNVDLQKVTTHPEKFMKDFAGGQMTVFKNGKATTIDPAQAPAYLKQGYGFVDRTTPAPLKPAPAPQPKIKVPTIQDYAPTNQPQQQLQQMVDKQTLRIARKNIADADADLDTVGSSADWIAAHPEMTTPEEQKQVQEVQKGVAQQRRIEETAKQLAEDVNIKGIMDEANKEAAKQFSQTGQQIRSLDPLGYAADPLAKIVQQSQQANKQVDPDKLVAETYRQASAQFRQLEEKNRQRFIQEAKDMGIPYRDYVKAVGVNYLNKAAEAMHEALVQQGIPKTRADWYVEQLKSSIVGNLASGAVTTGAQKEVLAEAKARNEMGEGFQPTMVDKALGVAASLAPDTPVMMGFGAGVNAAMRGLGLLSKAAVAGNTIRVANATLRNRFYTAVAPSVFNMSANLSLYEGAASGINYLNTNRHISFSEFGSYTVEGMGHGAVSGALIGSFGKLYNNIFSPYLRGVTGLETSFTQKLMAHGRRFVYHTGALAAETAGFVAGGAATGEYSDKQLDIVDVEEKALTVIALKASPQHAAKVLAGTFSALADPRATARRIWNKPSSAYLAQLSPDIRKEIDNARGSTKFFDYVDKILQASEKLANEKAKVAPGKDPVEESPYVKSLQNEYNKLTRELSWDAQNALNTIMFGVTTATRPRMQYITKRDGKLYEMSKDDQTLSVFKPADPAEEAAWIKTVNNRRTQNDVKAAFYAASQRMFTEALTQDPSGQSFRNLLNNFMTQHPELPMTAKTLSNVSKPGTRESRMFMAWMLDNSTLYRKLREAGFADRDIQDILEKKPQDLTDEDITKLNQINDISRQIAFPKGDVHPEQAKADGENAAEKAGLGTDTPNTELVNALSARISMAEQRLSDFIKAGGAGQLYQEYIKSMTPEQAYFTLFSKDGYTEEQLAPIAEYINATAAQQGIMERTEMAIEENAEEWVQQVKYQPMGQQPDDAAAQVIAITDKAGGTLYIKAGEFQLIDNGDGTTRLETDDAGILVTDKDGNHRIITDDEVISVSAMGIDDAREARKAELEQINQQAIQAAQPPKSEQPPKSDDPTDPKDLTPPTPPAQPGGNPPTPTTPPTPPTPPKKENGVKYHSGFTPSDNVRKLEQKAGQLSSQLEDLNKKLDELRAKRTELTERRKQLRGKRRQDVTEELEGVRKEINDLLEQMEPIEEKLDDATEEWREAHDNELSEHLKKMSTEQLVAIQKKLLEEYGDSEGIFDDPEENAINGILSDRDDAPDHSYTYDRLIMLADKYRDLETRRRNDEDISDEEFNAIEKQTEELLPKLSNHELNELNSVLRSDKYIDPETGEGLDVWLYNEMEKREMHVPQKPGTGAESNESAETKPVGKGVFGNIYDQFKGKVKEAVNFLMQKKEGQVRAVFHRDEVGDVDLVWGNGKAGLMHIILKHVVDYDDFSSVDEATDTITDVMKNGNYTVQKDGRVAYVKDQYRVAIEKGENGNWIITALDTSRKKKDKKRSEQDATLLHQSIFGEENGELVSQQPALTEGKDNENTTNLQEKGGDNAENPPTPKTTREQYTLTEDQIKNAEGLTDDMKDAAIDYLNGEDSVLGEAIYKQIALQQPETTPANPPTPPNPPASDVKDLKDLTDLTDLKAPKDLTTRPKTPTQTAEDIAREEKQRKIDAQGPTISQADAQQQRIDDLKKQIADKLRGFGKKGQGELPANILGMNKEQMQTIVDVIGLSAQLGFEYIKKGYRSFEAFSKKLNEDIGDLLRGATGWTEKDMNEFYSDVWKFKVRDEKGERKPISQWAEEADKADYDAHKDADKEAVRQNERRVQENNLIVSIENALRNEEKLDIRKLRKLAKDNGMKLAGEDVKDGVTDTDLQEFAELAAVSGARKIIQEKGLTKEAYDDIVKLYNRQPTVTVRDSEKIKKQQFSTPSPMAAIMALFSHEGKKPRSVLEPSAGNGALVLGFDNTIAHVNDIDPVRLDNLHRQGFKTVSSQDGTLPFAPKAYDVVVTNPPFSKPNEVLPAKEVTVGDRVYKLTSLDQQMAANALDSMKDDGRACIIIGGNTAYNPNGSLKGKDLQFLSFLYDQYNVTDIINFDGAMFAKNGTKFPVRMILIDGRRTETSKQRFAPVRDKADAEPVKSYEELYKRYEKVKQRLNNKDYDLQVSGEHPDRMGDGMAPDKGHPGRGGSDRDDQEGTGADTGRGGAEPQPPVRLGTDKERQRTATGRVAGEADEERPGDTQSGSGEPHDGDRPGTAAGAPQSQTADDAGEVLQGGTGVRPAGRPRQRGDGHADTDHGTQPGRGGRPDRPGPDRTAAGGDADNLLDKVEYSPVSNGNKLGVKTPAKNAADVRKALQKIKDEHGDIDEFVRQRLGYDSKVQLYKALAAEQIDGVAMAIYQMEHGSGFIIGDGTGVGKGRQAAALLIYGMRQGKVPVFVTQNPKLFADIYRDMKDMGMEHMFHPLIVNKGDSDVNIKDEKTGKILFRGLEKPEHINGIYNNGKVKLPAGTTLVLLSYTQVGSGHTDFVNGRERTKRKKSGKFTAAEDNGQVRRDFLQAIAKDNILVLDESHMASGAAAGYFMKTLSDARGVTFLSGTFAKRPDSMPIYAQKTIMSAIKGRRSIESMLDAIRRGGPILQEVMSEALFKAGQMIRRERPTDGVVNNWVKNPDPDWVKFEREASDKLTSIFRDMANFQRDFIEPYLDIIRKSLAGGQGQAKKGNMGLSTTNFASNTYNLIRQMSFALKAKHAADMAIKALKEGRKPVIAVSNTFEAFQDDLPLGVEIDMPDFSATMERKLATLLSYRQKVPGSKESVKVEIPLSQLPEEAQAAYNKILAKIQETSSGLSISPIDQIIWTLNEAGYTVGELTGRDTMIEKRGDKVVRRNRTTQEKDSKQIVYRFNNTVKPGDMVGELDGIDAVILNKSSATGISLHASGKFANSDTREMIIAQLEADINDAIQMLGRINRTGQVSPPIYTYLTSNIPAENRLLMMYKAKIKSLFANTTASQDAKDNEVEVVDMLNKYGDQIALQYMIEHPDVVARMFDPFNMHVTGNETVEEMEQRYQDTLANIDQYDQEGTTMSKFMARLATLSVEEQERITNEVEEIYNNKIEALNEAGENTLVATELPLNAKTISRQELSKGTNPESGNPFEDNVYAEIVEVDVLSKPMTTAEIQKEMKKLSEGKEYDDFINEKLSQISKKEEDTVAQSNKRIENNAEAQAKKARNLHIKGLKKDREDKKNNYTDEEIQISGDRVYETTKEEILSTKPVREREIRSQFQEFKGYLQFFKPGAGLSIPDKEDVNATDKFRPGMLIGFKFGKSLTPKATMAVFATADGRRKESVPLGDRTRLRNIAKASQTFANDTRVIKLGPNWDKWNASTPAREQRVICNGNILEMLIDNPNGKIIRYTTQDGEIKTGVLMQKDFVPVAKKPMSEAFSDLANGKQVASVDGTVLITPTRYGFNVVVPRDRKTGGKIYLDDAVLQCVDYKNFFSNGGTSMAATVSSVESLQRLLGHLDRLGYTTPKESGIKPSFHKVYQKEAAQNAEKVSLMKVVRDRVVNIMRKAGIQVSTDWQEGQRVLDSLKVGDKVNFMGTTTRKRQAIIAETFNGKELSSEQRDIVDAFSGIKKRVDITVVDKKGKSRSITFRQGKDNYAGVTHSIFGHFKTSKDYYEADEILMIPDIISKGERNQNGSKVSYSIVKDGVEYTVTTEIKGKGEEFTNFYTNRKPKDLEQGASNTDYQHAQPNLSDSAAKVQNLSDSASNSSENPQGNKVNFFRTKNGDVYGFAYDGKIYIDPRIVDSAETPIHEYTHLWAQAIRQSSQKKWAAIVKLMKGQKELWKEISDQYSDLTSDDDIAEEALAMFSGRRGNERLIQQAERAFSNPSLARRAVDAVRNAVRDFWRATAEKLGIPFTSAEHIADKALKDLVAFRNPNDVNDLKNLKNLNDLNNLKNLHRNDPLATAARIAEERRQEKLRQRVKQEIGASGKTFEEIKDGTPAERQVMFAMVPQYNDVIGQQQRIIYETQIGGMGAPWKEAHFDFLRPLRALQEALTGKAKEVLDAHNVYDKMKTLRSVIGQQQIRLRDNQVKAFYDAVSLYVKNVMQNKDLGRKDAYQLVKEQLYAMSGLERNRILFIRDFIEKQRKINPSVHELTEWENAEYERLSRGIDWDAMTEEEAEKKSSQLAKEAHQKWIDYLQQQWYDVVRTARDDTFDGYLDRLDDFIHEFSEYDPTDKASDRSGINNLAGGFDDSGHFDERAIRDDIIYNALDMGLKDTAIFTPFDYVNNISKHTIDKQFESGLIDRKYKNHLEQMMAFYLPMRKWDEKMAEDVYGYQGSDFDNNDNGRINIKAEGRHSLPQDPLINLVKLANQAITLGERNKAKNALLRLVNATYNPEDKARLVTKSETWLELIGKDPAGNDVWDISEPDIKENMTPQKVADEFERWQQDMQQKRLLGMAKVARGRINLPYKFEKKIHERQHAVVVYANGKPVTLWINSNPRAAQAINGALTPGNNNVIDKYIGGFARYMSASMTSWSPSFALRNPLRDLNFGLWNVYAKEGAGYAAKDAAQWFKNIGQFSFGGNTFGGYLSLYRKGVAPKTKYQEYFKEFMDNGGRTGYVNNYTIDKAKKDLEAAINTSNWKKIKKGARAMTLGLMEEINDRAENLMRFATYATSRNAGKTILQAINDAKDVSTNFDVKGSRAKAYVKGDVNSLFAGYSAELLHHLYLFVNPAMQSLAILGRDFKHHPVRAAAGMLSHMAVSALWPTLMGYLAYEIFGEDESAKNAYENLPEWDRRANACFYLGNGKWFKLPLGIETSAAWALGQIYASYCIPGCENTRSSVNPALDIASVLTQLSPVDPLSTDGKSLLVSLSPYQLAPLAQAYENKKWTGAPIEMQEERWNKTKPKWTRAFQSTSPLLVSACREMASWFTEEGSDPEIEAGPFDFSPGDAETIMRGYFGGYGVFLSDVASLASGEVNLKRLPVIKGVFTATDQESEDIRISAKYRTLVERVEAHKQILDGYKKKDEENASTDILGRKKYNDPVLHARRMNLENKWGKEIEIIKEAKKMLKEPQNKLYHPANEEEKAANQVSVTDIKRQALISLGEEKQK